MVPFSIASTAALVATTTASTALFSTTFAFTAVVVPKVSFVRLLPVVPSVVVRAPPSANTKLAMSSSSSDPQYSMADQEKRFGRAKKENNQRYLDIESVYDPSYIKGKRIAVTGANRGVGLSLAKEIVAQGGKLVALVRSSSEELDELEPDEVITDVDVTSDDLTERFESQVKGGPIDILINNAGYFYEPVEKIDSLNFKEELTMINVCALGPLRVTSGLYNSGLLKEGSVVAVISSQGGSVSWRTTQNPTGGDYGHHMSKAAVNMASVLLSQELKDKKIAVGIFHPGFNRTDMTKKYSNIWDEQGAVDPIVGAKRILHEVGHVTMDSTGKFINCEDGLQIPW